MGRAQQQHLQAGQLRSRHACCPSSMRLQDPHLSRQFLSCRWAACKPTGGQHESHLALHAVRPCMRPVEAAAVHDDEAGAVDRDGAR